MSAFDDCNDYKSNASSIDRKDLALHSLCKLFCNAWYDVSLTFQPGRDSTATG